MSLQDLFLSVKGIVEEIFVVTNAGKPVFSTRENISKPWHTHGAAMDIHINERFVGQIGYVTEKTLKVFEKGTRIIWFELNVDLLTGSIFPVINYKRIPVYPGSWMDFSILTDKSSKYDELAEILKDFSDPILQKSKFLYLYDGEGLPDGKTSYTFRFWLGLKERTLTGEDLSAFHDIFLGFLEKHGLTLR